jgi:hypothetical protein
MKAGESVETKFQESFGSDLVQTSRVHLNLSQDVIITTEDKLRLCLGTQVEAFKHKQAWIAPVSLFVTLLIVFATSTFKEFILPAATWQAVFVICTIAAAIWSIFAVIKAIGSRRKLDDLVNDIKKSSEKIKKGD